MMQNMNVIHDFAEKNIEQIPVYMVWIISNILIDISIIHSDMPIFHNWKLSKERLRRHNKSADFYVRFLFKIFQRLISFWKIRFKFIQAGTILNYTTLKRLRLERRNTCRIVINHRWQYSTLCSFSVTLRLPTKFTNDLVEWI